MAAGVELPAPEPDPPGDGDTDGRRPLWRTNVPQRLIDTAIWCAAVLVIFGFVLTIGIVAEALHLVVIPLLTATLLTALLYPVTARLKTWGLPRGVAALLTVFLAIAVLGGVGAFVVERANSGYPHLVDQIEHLVTKVQHWLHRGPLHLKTGGSNDIGNKLVDYLKSRKGELAGTAIGAGKTVFEVLGAIVLTLFLTIFMLYDGAGVWAWIRGLFPAQSRAKVDDVGDRMWATLSGYITGTFIVAVIHGVVMGITLWIVGVPLVAPLSVLIFIGSFIPIVGIVIFGGLAVLVTLVSNGTTAGIVVLVVLIIENQIEGHVLQPFVVGRHVRLHPMAIALTLGAGAILAGLPGAIFGVPLVASVNAARNAIRGSEILDHTGTPIPPDHDPPPAIWRRLWRVVSRRQAPS